MRRRAHLRLLKLTVIAAAAAGLCSAQVVRADPVIGGILRTHCVACHAAPPGRPAPIDAPVLPELTDPARLATVGRLLTPGLPDASLLYNVLLARHAPRDLGAAGIAEPDAAAIARVRAWIAGLSERAPLVDRSRSALNTGSLTLEMSRPAYALGDLISVRVSTDRACRLTVIAVDASAAAVVLFPNDLSPNPALAPGATLEIPDPAAGYRLRANRRGREMIVAHCHTGSADDDPIEPAFATHRFTLLGPWEAYLDRLVREDAAERQTAARSPAKPPTGPEDTPHPRPRPHEARTAVTFDTE